MQVLVLLTAAIVNTLSPICVYTVVTMMLSYIWKLHHYRFHLVTD